jgi:hypothetical protein
MLVLDLSQGVARHVGRRERSGLRRSKLRDVQQRRLLPCGEILQGLPDRLPFLPVGGCRLVKREHLLVDAHVTIPEPRRSGRHSLVVLHQPILGGPEILDGLADFGLKPLEVGKVTDQRFM